MWETQVSGPFQDDQHSDTIWPSHTWFPFSVFERVLCSIRYTPHYLRMSFLIPLLFCENFKRNSASPSQKISVQVRFPQNLMQVHSLKIIPTYLCYYSVAFNPGNCSFLSYQTQVVKKRNCVTFACLQSWPHWPPSLLSLWLETESEKLIFFTISIVHWDGILTSYH